MEERITIERTRLIKLPKNNVIALIVVIFFALAFAFLEYNYILFDTIPLREAKPPAIANLYSYDLIVFIPALIMFSFYPLIYQTLQRKRIPLRRPTAFGVASLLLSLIIKDAGWYLFRALAPVASDPLAHQWIRPSDYTATLLGYAEILGLRIPLWYIALSPLIIAIFVSLIISQNTSQKENALFSDIEGNKPATEN